MYDPRWVFEPNNYRQQEVFYHPFVYLIIKHILQITPQSSMLVCWRDPNISYYISLHSWNIGIQHTSPWSIKEFSISHPHYNEKSFLIFFIYLFFSLLSSMLQKNAYKIILSHPYWEHFLLQIDALSPLWMLTYSSSPPYQFIRFPQDNDMFKSHILIIWNAQSNFENNWNVISFSKII